MNAPTHVMVPITAHAVLRFLERSGRVDMVEWRKKAAAAGVDVDAPAAAIAFLEARGVIDSKDVNREICNIVGKAYLLGAHKCIVNGLAFVIDGGRVVTVLHDRMRMRHWKRRTGGRVPRRRERERRACDESETFE